MDVKAIKLFLKKESPSILVGVGAAGVAFVAFSSGKASIKASKILEEMHYTSEVEPPMKEQIKAVVPIFIPTIAIGFLTIGCFIASHSIDVRRQAALLSAYSLSEKAFAEYEDKVKELFGEKKASKVYDEIAHDNINTNPPNKSSIVVTGYGDTIFRDTITGGDFKSDIETVKSVFNKINSSLNQLDYATVNDLRYDLGLPQIKVGEDLGWVPGDQIEWSFSSVEVNETCTDGISATAEDLESMKVIAIRYTRPGFMPDM